MIVRVASGQVDAYKPTVGQLPDTYTLATSSNAQNPSTPTLSRAGKTLTVSLGSDAQISELLVRVPDAVSLDASSGDGAVNITDITGVATAHAENGNVKVMVEGYAQASAGTGNVTVYMGSTDWPGTLHFSSNKGDVEIWINATANFHVHMHTDDGTVFTDFPLRGTASGTSETIVGNVGDKNSHAIDIQAHDGSIRLLQLKPQI